MITTTHDVLYLESRYINRNPLYGEAHDHAKTGGTSDGQRSLSHWIGAMEALKMDFAAILDHKQVRHMYLPEFKEALFLGGTEPGTKIIDSKATANLMHYLLHVPTPEVLEQILTAFPEFAFEGGSEGHFTYPTFTTARFCELIDALHARGGFFVHPHPAQYLKSDDPLDYWFRDETGLEIFYGNMANEASAQNYKLWTDLLKKGKRVFAVAGGDGHGCCSDAALTTIYAEEKTNTCLLNHMREGDMVCGAVGIRMCMGNTRMGGKCAFSRQRLIFSVGDFHRSVCMPEHNYRVDLFDDKGIVFSRCISCTEPSYFALPAQAVKFYRVEVWDETRNLRIAIGNPIWNEEA